MVKLHCPNLQGTPQAYFTTMINITTLLILHGYCYDSNVDIMHGFLTMQLIALKNSKESL